MCNSTFSGKQHNNVLENGREVFFLYFSDFNHEKQHIYSKHTLSLWFYDSCKTHQAPDAAAAAKSLQLCPTLCDPRDGSPTGSTVPGILQTRTLEWVAISFSNAWKWKVKLKSLSRVRLLATPWTAAHQAPLSMGFSRQKYWSGVPLPSPSPSIREIQIRTAQDTSLHTLE